MIAGKHSDVDAGLLNGAISYLKGHVYFRRMILVNIYFDGMFTFVNISVEL